jgi:hypothetical protein
VLRSFAICVSNVCEGVGSNIHFVGPCLTYLRWRG